MAGRSNREILESVEERVLQMDKALKTVLTKLESRVEQSGTSGESAHGAQGTIPGTSEVGMRVRAISGTKVPTGALGTVSEVGLSLSGKKRYHVKWDTGQDTDEDPDFLGRA